ncbi:cupin domain-containing protein, partial [Mesorhizobium sp. M1143]|uniref:cupin domain-containing protein n=1 Tax=Mesorhizobium sp. M1143 TaxID=2957061 RepID=UPI00333D43B4
PPLVARLSGGLGFVYKRQSLSGGGGVAVDGGAARRGRAGDSFVLRPGFRGSWEVLETTRKEYVIKL